MKETSHRDLGKRNLETYKKLAKKESIINTIFYSEESKEKRKEIYDLAKKYSINESQIDSLIKYYLTKRNLPKGNIINSTDFINYILKNIYNFSSEEVSTFLNKNALIMKSSYTDFRIRLAIFNHIGLLDEIIFKGSYYLTYEFTLSTFGTRSLYAIIMEYGITSLEELKNLQDANIDINKLKEKYPLTTEIIHKLNEELERKIRRLSFQRLREERKLKKSL